MKNILYAEEVEKTLSGVHLQEIVSERPPSTEWPVISPKLANILELLAQSRRL